MSARAKLTLLITSTFTAIAVLGVHHLQRSEKAAMHAGVLRDEERSRLKRERQLDFEMQSALEKELRGKQNVRDTTETARGDGGGREEEGAATKQQI